MFPRALAFLGLLLLASCSATRTTVPEAPPARSIVIDGAKGWLCIVGGGGTTEDMYTRMLAAAGGNDAKVVILPQASEVAETGANSVETWKKRGATNVEWLDLKDPARDAEKVRGAQVIWFPGGVQTRLMKALHEAGLVELVRERFVAGAVVGGTSAGAAVMSDVMITGDYDLGFKGPAEEAPTAPAAGAEPGATPPSGTEPGSVAASSAGPSGPGVAVPPGSAGPNPPANARARERAQGGAAERAPRAERSAEDEDSGLKYVRNGTNVFSTGLGLMPGAIVDQHFVRRQRFNRLLSAVMDHPELVGIGIDEKTSILVHGNRFEVVGASNVLVVDARGASESSKDRSLPGSIRGARVSVLRAGQSHDFTR